MFCLKDGELEIYPASRLNSFYSLSNDNALVIGSSSRHAIYINQNMRFCSTGECSTFKSPPLCPLTEFECAVIELWKLVK